MADTKISALTALTGANADISADAIAVVDTSVTTTKKMLLNELGIAINLYHVGTFTKDTTDATGTTAYTGVGFQPKAIVFLCSVNGTTSLSIGIDDGTTKGSVYDNNAGSAGTYGINAKALTLEFPSNAAIVYDGYVSSFDSDGFTISWTRTGSFTGTATVYYLALR